MPARLTCQPHAATLPFAAPAANLQQNERLSRCPEALAGGLGAQGFSANVWANGAMVGGVLKHPGRLGKEASDNLAESWKQTQSGPQGAGTVAILEEGMTYEKVEVSPEDAELLDSRRFSVEELCRVFNVPPPIIGEWTHATFSNTASAREWFAALTLLQWVNKIEREFSRVVINDPDVALCFDLSACCAAISRNSSRLT
jgi:HK97 family phage portal protein